MCLNPENFCLVQGGQEQNLDDITSILFSSDRLTLVDATGAIEEVIGTIEEIDLLNRRIVMAA